MLVPGPADRSVVAGPVVGLGCHSRCRLGLLLLVVLQLVAQQRPVHRDGLPKVGNPLRILFLGLVLGVRVDCLQPPVGSPRI